MNKKDDPQLHHLGHSINTKTFYGVDTTYIWCFRSYIHTYT